PTLMVPTISMRRLATSTRSPYTTLFRSMLGIVNTEVDTFTLPGVAPFGGGELHYQVHQEPSERYPEQSPRGQQTASGYGICDSDEVKDPEETTVTGRGREV